ncbi:MAG: acetyl-CoA carboxylase biotin carboxyl carrier protein [Gammaproteobacteria bacterium]|nr:acetyl-CoA carboxylase biotin carboxyl carrier protein [Gammaproteobacteria bacterium]
MDIRKVKKLIELLEESGVAEIEVCEGEESVRISRQINSPATQTVVQVPDAVQAQAPATGSSGPVSSEATETGAQAEEGHVITSPMVGIFYAAPAPGEAPFVSVGQSVQKGDVVCVLEAMKIMNQIESDVSGTVVRVHVSNGEAVEYGQPLFTILEAS